MGPAGDELVFADIPASVRAVLSTLIGAGHEVVLVGGCVRDRLIGEPVDEHDWDAATSAMPADVAAIFAEATWENRFGTVTVNGDPSVEVTSYRTEAAYHDARRPDEVRFGASLEEDLARRDFTINAVAWAPVDLGSGRGSLIDPFGGRHDLERRVLRTVGNPHERFGEDALRLVRAARFAGRLGLELDPATEAAIVARASAAASVSGERLRDELVRILERDRTPSRALRLMERLGLLTLVLPEVAALRGVPQAKRNPGDALDHTLATVDAAPTREPEDVRLAGLLHDVGKATTLADGHFIGHEEVGALLAARALDRLRVGRSRAARIVAVVRHHMYAYEPAWTDAAVRRFIGRTHGVDRELLFALRRADDVASGVDEADATLQDELERRVAAELAGHRQLLEDRRLAIDGHDLVRELGLAPGPEVGHLLERLTEAVLDDPQRNQREALLELAHRVHGER